MFALVALAALVLLLLDRNHRPGLGPAGSTDVVDRDRQRVAADLVFLEPAPQARPVTATKAATARLATWPR